MKELLLVSIGSFFGGGVRFMVSKYIQAVVGMMFPLGTMAVNIAGCFVIGLLSGLNWKGGMLMQPATKLLLTTGFCGGFTTFSTFMNEGTSLLKNGNTMMLSLYVFGSIALGFVAVIAGQQVAKMLQA